MRWIDKVVIIFYAAAFILSEFIVVGVTFHNQVLSTISIIALCIAFLLFACGIIVNYGSDLPKNAPIRRFMINESIRNDPKRWLQLQCWFTTIFPIFGIVAVINVFIGLSAQPQDPIVIAYYLLAAAIIPSCGFVYLNSARNLLGMGYSEIAPSSLNGAKAFAKLSLTLLEQKEWAGVGYLKKSLLLLKTSLKTKDISCVDVDRALKYVTIMGRTIKDVPFESMSALSKGISEITCLYELPQHLQTFIKHKQLVNAKSFSLSKPLRSSLLAKLPLVAVILTGIGIAVQVGVPETSKGQIINVLNQWFTTPAILIILAMVFFALLSLYFYAAAERFSVNEHHVAKM